HGVLDDDVGGRHEVEQPGAVLRGFEVEYDSAFRAIGVDINVRQHRHHLEPAFATGRLHLHDIGAQLGQEARGEGAGPERGEVDDAVPTECTLLCTVPPEAAASG